MARKSSAPADTASRLLEFVVVGIGASAGGLEAIRALLDTVPSDTGMAFIVVQHLDPTHDSLLVEILSRHTRMAVLEAVDGMEVASDHVYIIPPGTYLATSGGRLHLSSPTQRHGARLPFDFTLHSLAESYGPNAACVILSGNGNDGSAGLKAIATKGGLVIAQAPDEAGFDGMPKNAVATGQVDLVLPVADMAQALVKYQVQMAETDAPPYAAAKNPPQCLPDIVALLRSKTAHDYSLYKTGTLQRRIERRMTLASIVPGNMAVYLDRLRQDDDEVAQLAKDLLIHVTGFFRDPTVFSLLADKIVPDLIKAHPRSQPIRIWSVGCSTGEEAYSLAMIFREALSRAGRDNRLQVFASDADPDAIARAREGLYSTAIEADVSAERLATFFSKEEGGYRISPHLRACVVFTVQDILSDPPFSRLDLVSCRNLLIYLGPEAQAKAISLFHFALLQGGLLLLGASESPGGIAGRFEMVSKPERIFRQIGRSRPGDFGFSQTAWAGIRSHEAGGAIRPLTRPPSFAEFCRQWALESAPPAVLLNGKKQVLFSLGAVNRYLTLPEGDPSMDLLSMARDSLRPGLRSVLQQAARSLAVEPGKRPRRGPSVTSVTYDDGKGGKTTTRLEVQATIRNGETFFLVRFIPEILKSSHGDGDPSPSSVRRVHDVELELETTRTELESVLRDFELSAEEQKAVNEEASSVNEEYQSANEELLTSKEELQSLNEELTALNSQLQETLDRQRITATDLQNVLYSTNVATLFLDTDLNIRFFTPTTRSVFNIIPSDIGRPLSDLHSLAHDNELPADAARVLKHLTPVDREVETSKGLWFLRRVMPYLTDGDGTGNGVDGVVITFTDITERNRVARDLQAAKQEADLANIAKTRFLAAASHDLRQPLQSLALLQGLLAKTAGTDTTRQLVLRLDETIETMSGMLNTLLDINQFESGMVRVHKIDVPVNAIFERLKNEFMYHAQARGLTFKVMPCSLTIVTDPALLEQLIRNLLSNAMKYTQLGGVLLGCRRQHGCVRIEVRDSGIGIGDKDLEAIFDEYYQVDNPARQRSRGLGLGLSIVKRLADVLDHPISVRSQPGRGSVFSIEVRRPATVPTQQTDAATTSPDTLRLARTEQVKGTILVVEDDPEVRGLVQMLLESDGHRVVTAGNGPAALSMLDGYGPTPDLILADFNLPDAMTGVEAARRITERLKHKVPVIILTGDVSVATVRAIALSDCLGMNKPVRPDDLLATVQGLLSAGHPRSGAPASTMIYVVDDDADVRDLLTATLSEDGFRVASFGDAESFLAHFDSGLRACLLIDAGLPGMSGLELLHNLRAAGHALPAIMITGNSDVAMAVAAMKAGASDFLEKPVRPAELTASVDRALAQSVDATARSSWQAAAARHLDDLTLRQRQIMHLVLAGHPSKNIAADLGISQRTVENHRAAIMSKTGTKSLPALARLAMAADATGSGGPE